MIVNQWVPAAHKGDAIGDSARRVRALLREMGHQSDLYAMTMDDDLRGDVIEWTDAGATRGDLTIFHFALVSPMTGAFARLHARAACCSITTSRRRTSFAGYDANIFRLAMLGREDLKSLVGHTDLALGDSEYNRQELEDLGFTNTGVFPIAVDTGRITNAPRRPALEEVLNENGWTNFLFVGRIVPNKKIEDHIKLAEHYKRYVDEQYRFVFVGKTDATPRYYMAIRALLERYRMPQGRFIFTGAGAGRGSRHLLPHRERLPVAVRARRLLRAAARGDGGGRAGAGVCLDGGARHARRRRRPVRTQGSRTCGGAPRRARLQRQFAEAGHCRAACPSRRLRRRPHSQRA